MHLGQRHARGHVEDEEEGPGDEQEQQDRGQEVRAVALVAGMATDRTTRRVGQ